MKVISKCKFCNDDIVFLRSKNDKPTPANPQFLSMSDFETLVRGGMVSFDYGRHACHLATCCKHVDGRALVYMRGLAAEAGCY